MARTIVAGSGAGSRVIGVGRLRRTLRRLPETVQAPVKARIKDGAQEIEFAMKQRVPVDDGDLAAGINFKVSRDGLSAKIGYIGKRIMQKVGWRALFAEFGWGPGTYKRGKRKGKSFKGAPAQPFMIPAMRAKINTIITDINAAVDNALRKAGRVR